MRLFPVPHAIASWRPPRPAHGDRRAGGSSARPTSSTSRSRCRARSSRRPRPRGLESAAAEGHRATDDALKLSDARAELRVRTGWQAAQVRDRQMQARLEAAIARLADAQADLAAGRQRLADRARVTSTITSILEEGTPSCWRSRRSTPGRRPTSPRASRPATSSSAGRPGRTTTCTPPRSSRSARTRSRPRRTTSRRSAGPRPRTW